MAPSGVNDTMRSMMAQIRLLGDLDRADTAVPITGNTTVSSAITTGYTFTGALIATAIITFPATLIGMVAVRNNTTGSQSLSCGISGGDFIEVRWGETVVAWSDGVDFMRLSAIGGLGTTDPDAITAVGQAASIRNSTLTSAALYAGLLGTPAIYDALQVVAKVPASSTAYQVNALSAYLENNMAFSAPNGAGTGLISLAVGVVNNSHTWGANFGVVDSSTAAISAGTGKVIVGLELNPTATSPHTTVQGISILGSSPSQPVAANAITVGNLGVQSPGTAYWDFSFISEDNASLVALVVGTLGTGVGALSQPIQFNYVDGAAVGQAYTQQVNSNGHMAFNTTAGSGDAVLVVDGSVVGNGLFPQSDLTKWSLAGSTTQLLFKYNNFVEFDMTAGTGFTMHAVTAPGAPAAGYFTLYMDTADNRLKCIGPSGTRTTLAQP